MSSRTRWLPLVGLSVLILVLSACSPNGGETDADDHGATAEPSAMEGETESADDHDRAADTPADDSGEDHAGEESEAGHGEPAVGYIGLENREPIPEAELEEWHDGVAEEAYRKGTIDQVRLIFFAVSFIVVFLAFAKIKILEPFSRVLRERCAAILHREPAGVRGA